MTPAIAKYILSKALEDLRYLQTAKALCEHRAKSNPEEHALHLEQLLADIRDLETVIADLKQAATT